MTIFDLIGNTPLVEIQKLNPYKNVTIYGKLEGQNPGGSVKDRAAYGMIKAAMDRDCTSDDRPVHGLEYDLADARDGHSGKKTSHASLRCRGDFDPGR